jgi:hypothetical protein
LQLIGYFEMGVYQAEYFSRGARYGRMRCMVTADLLALLVGGGGERPLSVDVSLLEFGWTERFDELKVLVQQCCVCGMSEQTSLQDTFRYKLKAIYCIFGCENIIVVCFASPHQVSEYIVGDDDLFASWSTRYHFRIAFVTLVAQGLLLHWACCVPEVFRAIGGGGAGRIYRCLPRFAFGMYQLCMHSSPALPRKVYSGWQA